MLLQAKAQGDASLASVRAASATVRSQGRGAAHQVVMVPRCLCRGAGHQHGLQPAVQRAVPRQLGQDHIACLHQLSGQGVTDVRLRQCPYPASCLHTAVSTDGREKGTSRAALLSVACELLRPVLQVCHLQHRVAVLLVARGEGSHARVPTTREAAQLGSRRDEGKQGVVLEAHGQGVPLLAQDQQDLGQLRSCITSSVTGTGSRMYSLEFQDDMTADRMEEHGQVPLVLKLYPQDLGQLRARTQDVSTGRQAGQDRNRARCRH